MSPLPSLEDVFRRALEAEVRGALEDILWEMRLDYNEMLFGSAYGPWPPPTEKVGLQYLLDPSGPVVGGWQVS